MYAILETGGKQYKVEPDASITVEKLEGNKGDEVVLEKVLMVGSEETTKVGMPYVTGAKVKAVIQGQTKGKKITIFKYKPKKRIRVKTGHRQNYTTLKIKEIVTAG